MADLQSLLARVTVDQAALACGLVFFFIGLIIKVRRNGWDAADLGPLLGVAVAAFAIPKGLFLVYLAFQPDLLTRLALVKDLAEQIAIAGLCAVFLACVTVRAGLK